MSQGSGHEVVEHRLRNTTSEAKLLSLNADRPEDNDEHDSRHPRAAALARSRLNEDLVISAIDPAKE